MSALTPINPHAPVRERFPADASRPLLFATMPRKDLPAYQVTKPANMIAQSRLYRAVRRGEFPNYVGIGAIHEFLFWNEPNVNKIQMGATVIRTVLYNPRKLKGVTKDNDHAQMMYAFGDIREFQHGLEWMICTWLRKFLNDLAAQDGDTRVISGPTEVAEELDALVGTHDEDYIDIYEKNIWKTMYVDPDWRNLCGDRVEISEVQGIEKAREFKKPAPPRSLWS